MLKSAKIKILQNQSMVESNNKIANSINDSNFLKEKEIEQEYKFRQEELETKDRVDLSKKEYLELLDIKKTLDIYKSSFSRLAKSLKCDEKLLLNAKDVQIDINENPVKLGKIIRIMFTVDNCNLEDNGGY